MMMTMKSWMNCRLSKLEHLFKYSLFLKCTEAITYTDVFFYSTTRLVVKFASVIL